MTQNEMKTFVNFCQRYFGPARTATTSSAAAGGRKQQKGKTNVKKIKVIFHHSSIKKTCFNIFFSGL